MSDKPKKLSEAEIKRLERLERTRQNRRGRRQPAPVPAKLARTSAFAPKRRGLNTDSNFRRTYVVPGHSVVEVSGRELGSQHRDALYALFRLKPQRLELPNPNHDPDRPAYSSNSRQYVVYETRTTWRSLIRTLGRTEHPNNLLSLLEVFRELQSCVVRVQEGDPDQILAATRRGQLGGPGLQSNIVQTILWDGVELDSPVTVRYGEWVRRMIEKSRLVSLNADVQFKLRSDHAKNFWPYIDSMVNHTFIDEDMLAALAGRDLWSEAENSATRAQFRKDCRQAFDDMVRAGGLRSWTIEPRGQGRRKTRRYHYIHALPRQIEFELASGSATP